MDRAFIGLLVSLLILVVFTPTTAVAQPSEVSISISPVSYDCGILGTGEVVETGLSYFTVANTGNIPVIITIGGTDMIGSSTTWTLSDTATPGIATYGMKAGLQGDADYSTIVKKEAHNVLIVKLTNGKSQDFGLKLWAPTNELGSEAVSSAITLTATKS